MKITTRILFLAAILAFAPSHAADFLKQSTASQAVKLGPFVDSVDGNTEETALTIANTDIKCSKNGAALASKNSGGGTHDANGWYTVTFDATDTNTVGRFKCFVHVSGALPVTYEANIVEEAVYDAFYGASAPGYVANAPVNVAQFGGTNGTFASGRPEVNMTHIAGSAVSTSSAQLGVNVVNLAGSAVSATSGVANVNVAQISTDSTAADTLETWLDGTAGSAMPIGIVDQGTAQSATSTTLVLRSALAIADDAANGMTIVACGSTQGYCQSRAVTDYTSSTDTATVDTWTVTPSGTITYYLFGTAPASGSGSAPSAATIADAVWDEARSGHVTSGTFGEYTPANVTTIAGSSVSTSTAQLGVNVVNFGGSAGTFASGRPEVNVSHFGGTAGTFTSGNPTVRISSGTGTGQVSLSSGTVTVGTNNDKTGYALSAAGVDAIWDEAQSGHATAGTFGLYLDSAISGVSSGGVSAATIADAVWDEALSGHTTSGTAGERLGRIPNAAAGGNGGLPTVNASNYVAGIQVLDEDLTTLDLNATAIGSVASAVTVGTNNDKTGYSLSSTGLASVLCPEPSAKPVWSSTSAIGFLCWQAAFSVNKVTQTSSTKTLRNDADNANIATCSVSDNGTTFTLNECSP